MMPSWPNGFDAPTITREEWADRKRRAEWRLAEAERMGWRDEADWQRRMLREALVGLGG